MDGRITDQPKSRRTQFGNSRLLALRPTRADQDAHAVTEGIACLGAPCRRSSASPEGGGRGRSIDTAQAVLDDDARRFRGAERLRSEDSTGRVPLQPG